MFHVEGFHTDLAAREFHRYPKNRQQLLENDLLLLERIAELRLEHGLPLLPYTLGPRCSRAEEGQFRAPELRNAIETARVLHGG